MFASNVRIWLKKFRALRRTPAARRSPSFRPRLEILEDRECPAIFNIAAGDSAGLIAALTTAQSNGEADQINLSASTYTLTAVNNVTNGNNGLPIINNDGAVNISGNGATITRDAAAPAFRIFNVVNGRLLMQNITISNGSGAFGGAIRVSDTTVGGLDNLVLRNSLLVNNLAANDGGGLFAGAGGKASLINSTVSTNTATAYGGGVSVLDGAGIVNIVNTTITRNVATTQNGGGLNVEGGNVNVNNSILADNRLISITGAESDLFRLPSTSGGSGTVNSSNSLYQDTPTLGPNSTLNGAQFNNKFGQNPQLGTLKNNGGLTRTHAITSATSPAVDAGSNALIVSPDNVNDQRGPGFNRIVNSTVDIGAYEYQPPATFVGILSNQNPAPVGSQVTFTAIVNGFAPNSNVVSGTVTYIIDGVAVATGALVNGVSTFTVSGLTAGNHTVRIQYNPPTAVGDYGFAAGTSGTLTQTMTPPPPPPNPLSPLSRRWRR